MTQQIGINGLPTIYLGHLESAALAFAMTPCPDGFDTKEQLDAFLVAHGYPPCQWFGASMTDSDESMAHEYCEVHGHDFEDHGYAEPDSGAIDLDCRRCGFSVHHQLY